MPFKNSKLKLRRRGKIVGQLQKILIAYGQLSDISDIRKQFFGTATQQALKQLQLQLKLRPSGVVDEATAKRLDTMFDQLFDESGGMNLFKVRGKVMHQNGKALNKVKVELWVLKRGGKAFDLKKDQTTNKQGRFFYEITARDLIDLLTGGIPKLFFKLYDGNELLEDTRNSVVWDPKIPTPELLIHVRASELERRTWTIKGLISSEDNTLLKDISVSLRDKKNDLLLGKMESNKQGGFELTFTDQQFPDWLQDDYLPTVYFTLFSGTTLLKSTADQPIKNLQSGSYDIDIHIDQKIEISSFLVKGTILSDKRVGQGNLLVRAYHKSTGPDELLGETTSEPSGTYELSFEAASADIEVQVFDPEDLKKALVIAPIRYNAKPEEIINVILGEGAVKASNEYSLITADLRMALGDKTFRDLEENDQKQDLTFLANKTGWDARMIAMVALADEYSKQTEVPAPYYYSMFRAGMPTSVEGINQVNNATADKIWRTAVEQNIIDSTLEKGIASNLQKFDQQSSQFLLNQAAPVGVSKLDHFLDVSLAGRPNIKNEKEIFASIYYNHQGTTTELWKEVERKIPGASETLQLDGKLGFLTINNAPLVSQLRTTGAVSKDPVELVQGGYYKTTTWLKTIGTSIAVPDNIPGKNIGEKRSNYAAYMATQIKLSYPTAVLAEQVKEGKMNLSNGTAVNNVHSFLQEHQEAFNISRTPIREFIKGANVQVDNGTRDEVERLQRTYQISPSDDTMATLLKEGLDSSYKIVQYGVKEFKDRFKVKLGSENNAALIYNKAHQVHSTVTNVAIGYLTHRNNPNLYVLNNDEKVTDAVAELSAQSDLIAYPTLEELFGEMDFCECKHCRSVLSPAAYLVDLLKFIDKDLTTEDIANGKENPLEVLLGRRPDIQHIQLTCENTQTVLPYVDLVNEILEHFTVHAENTGDISGVNFQPLDGFTGFNITEEMTTADLLANPQFVKPMAYEVLKNQVYPFSLPFHQTLESLRRYFEHLEVPLFQAMELMRTNDDLDLSGGADDPPYSWRDIYLEYLGISRATADILIANKRTLPEYFGYPLGTSLNNTFDANGTFAKDFTRTCGISYKELVRILNTQFINPAAQLIPELEASRVSINNITAFLDGTLSANDFDDLLPEDWTNGEKAARRAWLLEREGLIKGLILLVDLSGENDECSFETLSLRYADLKKLKSIDYFRLLRFIRLWKILGWSIEDTDRMMTALFKIGTGSTATIKLNNGFKNVLPKLALLKKTMNLLKLKPKRNLLKVLAFWADIDTSGRQSLYHKLFLNPSILKIDPVFQVAANGRYLDDATIKVVDHEPAVLAAFNLSSEEFGIILDLVALRNLTDPTDVPLSLSVLSEIHRYTFLSKALKISLQELIILIELSGLDPFGTLASVHPAMIQLIEMAHKLKKAKIKIPDLSYYLRHEDLSGEASPSQEALLAISKNLKNELQRIEAEFTTLEDVTGEVAQEKMTNLYGAETASLFFGLINGTSALPISYDHHQAELEGDITTLELGGQAIGQALIYNDFQKKISFQNSMTIAIRDAFVTAAAVLPDDAGQQTAFIAAIQELYDNGQSKQTELFAQFPELQAPFDAYVNDGNFDLLISSILVGFKKAQKALRLKQALGDLLDVDLPMIKVLTEEELLLHSTSDDTAVILKDFLSLEANGVSAKLLFPDDTVQEHVYPNVDFGVDTNALPVLPANQKFKAATLDFLIEVPQNDFFNIYIETEVGATVSLLVDKEEVSLTLNGTTWENTSPLALNGNQLHAVRLVVEDVRSNLTLKWNQESNAGAPRLFAVEQIFPEANFQVFSRAYLRLLKAIALIEKLDLSTLETKHWGTVHQIVAGKGFFNSIPISRNVNDSATPSALLNIVVDLLDYNQIKEEKEVVENQLLEHLQSPSATDDNGANRLFKLLNWEETSARYLLENHFGLIIDDLGNIPNLKKVHEAYQVVNITGLPSTLLTTIISNTPNTDTVSQLQNALRAKYDEAAWLKVIQPINDDLRNLQRSALVDHVLGLMAKNDKTKSINTSDKLFEYFLIDVEMDACMKTSRIKQALSTVQLFIHRCLINLEPTVANTYINSAQWQWMKRYRVWEANRKVFLYPENWLEPELRDNKSAFFKDLESELLQSDITDDAATTALLSYLEKLDEVAKLEICSIFLQENEKKRKGQYYGADDILHVFGRTPGVNRKYYYRRYEYGYWTAWERVKLDIEDNPILPVIWNGRLFLFWLNILAKGSSNADPAVTPATGDDRLTSAKIKSTSSFSNSNKIKVEASLSWSEYYNNKWQPRSTSDPMDPMDLGQHLSFDRNSIGLFAHFGDQNELFIQVDYSGYFKLYNKHSFPTKENPTNRELHEIRNRSVDAYASRLNIHYTDTSKIDYDLPYYSDIDSATIEELEAQVFFSHEVIKNIRNFKLTHPKHFIENIFEQIFFYEDRQHVFYVEPIESQISIPKYGHYGVYKVDPRQDLDQVILANEWDRPYEKIETPEDLRLKDPILDILRRGGDPRVTNPTREVKQFLESAVDNAILTTRPLQFRETTIGVSGSTVNEQRLNNKK